jgi:Ca2+-binding EF-hand superfamily protein
MASSVVGLNGGHVDDYNSQRLDLLDQRIRQKLGLKLTERELKAVRKKYDSRSITDTVDESVERLKRDLQAAMPASFVEQSDAYHSLSIDKVYTLLKDKIRERARSLGSSDSQLQEAVYLLSESRSPFLTRSQLKFGVSIRLNIHLSDKQIEEIFEAFDPMHTGVIKLMEFVKALLKTSSDELNASVLLKPSHQNLGNTSRGVEPTITYDHKVLNLESIYVAPQLRLTLVQIENAIRYKISERSFRGRNLQTLHKVFGDTRSGDAKGNLFISRDQIKYTLFKRFQLNLSDEEIELIFHKYDPEGRGKIPIRRFVKGIIEDEENANEPLIEEKYRGQVRNKSQVLINFLDFLRKKLHELINREGRAPHYWIHVTGRMSAAQAKAFLLEKFKVTVDEVVMKEIADHYESNRLIDVRLLILDVMTVEAKNIMGPEKSLVDGCVVVVDELPASLKDSRFHPDQIEDLLRNKLSERMKNEHPMSTMVRHLFASYTVCLIIVFRFSIRCSEVLALQTLG